MYISRSDFYKITTMKRFLSASYSATSFNIALFLLRVGAGLLMIPHGYSKLINFQKVHPNFLNFLGMGSETSLALNIFAEFFCSIFLVLGLFTRLAAIPLIIAMSVAIAKAHNLDFFGDGEKPTLFLLAFLTILLVGPGRASIDGVIRK